MPQSVRAVVVDPSSDGRLTLRDVDLPPAAPDGPHVAIRRFSTEALTVDKLLAWDALTPAAAEALRVMIASKLNVLIAGGTGSGKTSLLNALSSFIPANERIFNIAALCVFASILAHGLTDTPGSNWVANRSERPVPAR